MNITPSRTPHAEVMDFGGKKDFTLAAVSLSSITAAELVPDNSNIQYAPRCCRPRGNGIRRPNVA